MNEDFELRIDYDWVRGFPANRNSCGWKLWMKHHLDKGVSINDILGKLLLRFSEEVRQIEKSPKTEDDIYIYISFMESIEISLKVFVKKILKHLDTPQDLRQSY